jgi:SAM-dependent methyltransferase
MPNQSGGFAHAEADGRGQSRNTLVKEIAVLCCPSCGGDLKSDGEHVACQSCCATFEVSSGIINFVGKKNLIDEQEIIEINELVNELRQRSNDSVVDATSLPNRRNTAARYRSEIKSLKHLRRAYAHAFGGGRVLDYSCGAGRGARIAADLGAREIWVADITYSPVRYCLDVLQGFFKKTRFYGVVAASDSIPFRDDFFDAILIYGSLHHYPNMDEFLERCSRISRHIFIIAEPATLGLWQQVIDRFGISTEYGEADTHRVSESKLIETLSAAGMKVESERLNQYYPKALAFAGNLRPFYSMWFGGLRVLDALLPRQWKHSLNVYASRA